MAARTTESDVRAIIDYDTTITNFTPFIRMANGLVNECCLDAGYDDGRLLDIETCLAAHFASMRDRQARSEKAGSVGTSYDTKLDLYFMHTHHGQNALLLDTAGGLAALQEQIKSGGPVTVGITWLGKEPDE